MRVLFILLLFISFCSYGQIYQPTVATIYGQHNLRTKSDSVLHVPEYNDSLKHTTDLSAQLRVINGNLYYYSGVLGKWIKANSTATGNITGTGVAQRIPYWNSSNNISYTNNLVYDTALIRLGIGTSTPSSALDIHSSTNNMADLNNSSSTGSSFLLFQKVDTTKWKIGNNYNSGANTFEVQNIVKLNTPLSIDSNSKATFLNSPYVGSKRVVDTTDLAAYAKADSSIWQTKYRTDTSRTALYNAINGKQASGNYAIADSSVWQPKYRSDTMRVSVYNQLAGKQATLTQGSNITISGVTISADTTTGSTKLATQGYVTRNSSSGGLTGSGTVDSVLVPLTTWSVTNSKLSNTQRSYANWDTVNHALNIGTSTKQTTYKLNVAGAAQFVNANGGASQGVVITNNNNTGQSLVVNNGTQGAIYATGTAYALFDQTVNASNYGITCWNAGTGVVGDFQSANATLPTILNLTQQLGTSSYSGTSPTLQLTDGGSNYFSSGNGIGINWSMRRNISSAFTSVNSGNIGNVWVANFVSNPISALTFKAYSFNNGTNEVMRVTGNKTVQINTISNSDTLTALQVNGSLALTTAGNKISIATGSNASVGTATLSSGTVTVSTTAVTANSIILLSLQNCSNCGTPYISAKTAGTSFVISSTNVLDGSIVAYQIIN